MGKNNYIYESRRKQKESRMVIVAELYSRGKSYRAIRDEVIRALGLEKYSLGTVKTDVDSLLKEWRKERIDDTSEAVALALERNRQHYDMTREEWERSRVDRNRAETKRKGIPIKTSGDIDKSSGDSVEKIKTILKEEKKVTILGEGDPRYMDLMIKLEDQRAKLLGLFAPEEKRLTGANGDPLFSNYGDIDINKLSEDERLKLLELARKCNI